MTDIKKKELQNNNTIYIIDIKFLDSKLEKTLNNRIVSICEGCTNSDIRLVKNKINSLLDKKSKVQKMGIVAEFFIHLFVLNTLKFKQEFLFLNLEENSMKKGLDGHYSINENSWFMESKSGKISTEGISHKNKVREAYIDLKSKFEGKSKSPWSNAYNHASHLDINPIKSIREYIKQLENDYQDGIYHNIESFNIIPAGTIFLEGGSNNLKNSEVFNDIEDFISTNSIKNSIVLCVTHKSIEMFYEYIQQ